MTAPQFFQPTTILVTSFLLAASALAFVATQKSATLPQRKPYSVGETVKEEVRSFKKIAVVDPAETAARREAEAAKIPVVFRFQKDISDKAVASFSTEFVFTREKFLDTLEKNFKTRTLATNQIDKPRFRKMVNVFQADNKSYPVNLREASVWAQGEENLLKQLCAKLRQTTDRSIRPDAIALPDGPLTYQIRIFSGDETSPPLELLKQKGQLVRRTNFVTVAKARSELLASFPKEQRAVGKFLTNFVAPNYVFDAELTRRLRAEKTNTIWAVDSYEPGQIVVRRGEVVNAKSKAALDELKIMVPIAPSNSLRVKPLWLWLAAIGCALLALIIWLMNLRRGPRTALVPAGNVLVLPTGENFNDDLRARLIPHLARGLMDKFVHALISQRSELIRTQQVGTDQLAEIEQRLDQISTRLENRQAFYETRIAQLEKELAASEEENRELIRAKIHEARQNLEWAKTHANGGK